MCDECSASDGGGHIPGESDWKPLTAQQVNLLQHEHGQLRERVAELEAEQLAARTEWMTQRMTILLHDDATAKLATLEAAVRDVRDELNVDVTHDVWRGSPVARLYALVGEGS